MRHLASLCKCANIINSLHICDSFIHTDINRKSRDNQGVKHSVFTAKNSQKSFVMGPNFVKWLLFFSYSLQGPMEK